MTKGPISFKYKGQYLFGGGPIPEEAWKLPEDLRDTLRQPLGPIIQDEDLPQHVEGKILAVVGDVAALHVVRAGYQPKLVVVDFKTQRDDEVPVSELRLIGDECIKVVNPPALITRDLWNAIERAYQMDGMVRIEVEGEEDLAFIPCVMVAPQGSMVVYGMPFKGMVAVTVDGKSQGRVKEAFEQFERTGIDRG